MSDTERREVWRWSHGAEARRAEDELAAEAPLEIRVGGRAVSVTMRTPGDDQELAAGFLLTEGLIARRTDILNFRPFLRSAECNSIDIDLASTVQVDFEQLTRHVFASSSCGLCGKATIAAVHRHFPPVECDFTISGDVLLELPERLRLEQDNFGRTGGLHAAAIFNEKGELVVLREDVGRHNAVDKVLGYGLLRGLLPFQRHILLVSGRASFEILQKALAARVPVIAAISAPSSLAVQFAEESSQTLVGFLRDHRMNIYSHAARIRTPQ